MTYRKKSGYGARGFGGGRHSSGYLKRRDPMDAYRTFSRPPDEYERKLRARLERQDVSGMSGNFSADTSNYRNITRQPVETKLSQREVDELSDKILGNAIEEFKRINAVDEVPQEKYEVMHDMSERMTDRMEETKNHPNDNTTVLDFVKEFLYDDVADDRWHSDILEKVGEVQDQKTEQRYQLDSEITPQDVLHTKKRNDTGYESEFDAI